MNQFYIEDAFAHLILPYVKSLELCLIKLLVIKMKICSLILNEQRKCGNNRKQQVFATFRICSFRQASKVKEQLFLSFTLKLVLARTRRVQIHIAHHPYNVEQLQLEQNQSTLRRTPRHDVFKHVF